MQPAVEFEAVSYRYGSVTALDNVDLRVERGEVVALLGPNGAGKSTAMNLLLGVMPPDSGQVRLFGGDPAPAAATGRLTVMFQENRLPSRYIVADLLDFLHGAYANPIPVLEVFDIAGLTGILGRDTEKLSGGEAQRTRFAMALIGRPDLFVLDEPTSALDVESRRALWAALRGHAAEGSTVVFSTHNLDEAEDNADRVVVLAKGACVAVGSPAEIKRLVPGRMVSVEAGDSPALAELPGVVSVEHRAGRAYLTSTDADATVLELAARGLVRDLEVVGANLEEAFVALTEAGLTPGGPLVESAGRVPEGVSAR
jgi:ABC-2 type transport system ATP-binding protein